MLLIGFEALSVCRTDDLRDADRHLKADEFAGKTNRKKYEPGGQSNHDPGKQFYPDVQSQRSGLFDGESFRFRHEPDQAVGEYNRQQHLDTHGNEVLLEKWSRADQAPDSDEYEKGVK